MFQVWLCDNDGYFIKSKFVKKIENNMVTIPITIGFLKPKWNGTEWIESATEEEIKEWKEENKVETKSSKLELIKQENEKLKNQVSEIQDTLLTLMDLV